MLSGTTTAIFHVTSFWIKNVAVGECQLQTQCSFQHLTPFTFSSVQATLSFNYGCFLLFFILIKSDLLTISREIMSGKCLPDLSSELWKERYESHHHWMCQAAPSFRQQKCNAVGTDVQQDWGKPQLNWDHPPGMSTEQESQGTGYLAGRTHFSEISSVLSYVGSDFFPLSAVMQHQVNSGL